MKRLLWMVPVSILVLLAGLYLGALWWLQNSEGATRWMFDRAALATDGQLSAEKVSGSLDNGLVVHGLQWQADNVVVRVEQLSLRVDAWLARRLLDIDKLDAQNIRIETTSGEGAGSGSSIEEVLARMVLPWDIEIRLGEGRLQDIEWRHDGEPRLSATALTLGGAWSDHLAIEQARLSSNVFNGSVNGALALTGAHDGRVSVSGDVFGPDGEPVLSGLELALDGDRLELHVDGRSATPEAAVNGVINTPFEQWRVGVDVSLPQNLLPADLPLAVSGVNGRIEGRHDDWTAEAEGWLSSEWAEGALLVTGHGDLSGMSVETARFGSEDMDLAASGHVEWPDAFRMDAGLVVERWLPGSLLSSWPADLPVSGTATVRYADGNLVIEDGVSRFSGDTEVRFDGIYQAADQHAQLELEWESLTWPLEARSSEPAGELRTQSQGRASLTGQAESWRAVVDTGLSTPGYPAGRLQFNAAGNRDGARLERFSGELLGGTVAGQADLEWQQGLAVVSGWTAERLDVGALVPGLPMTVSASGALDWSAAERSLQLQVGELQGVVEGQPFEGRIDARFGPGGWEFPDLYLAAERLRYEDIVVHALDARTDSSRPDGIVIEAGPVEFGEQVLDHAVLRVDHARYPLAISAEANREDLRASAQASLRPGTATGDSGWSGALDDFRLRQGDGEKVALREATRFEYTGGQLHTRALCLDLRPAGGVCVDRLDAGAGQLGVDASLQQLPLSLVDRFWASDLRLSHTVSGQVAWQRGAGLPSGSAQLTISPGEVSEVGVTEVLRTGEGVFGFALESGALRSGVFSLPLPGLGEISAAFEVDGLALDGTGRVDGQIDARIDDITLLEALVPGLESADGRLTMEIGISGVVADPQMQGFARLENARFDMPVIGLAVRDLAVDGQVTRSDQLVLQGGFTAGEGQGRLSAQVDFKQLSELASEISISGEGLQLVDLSDLSIKASPDMTVAWRDQSWHVDGRVVIPQALVSPSSAFRARTGESLDVRVVAGERPGEQAITESRPLSLQGSLDVRLGENVRFDSDLASGRLAGGVTLGWTGKAMPMATGTIDVMGNVRAYGPVLRLDDAHVRFPTVALNNPVLDIRAEREVYGNTQVRSAGVFINGTARRPEVEAYTRPFTSEERAWTLLITGSDIDFSQGIGAFDIGTYIAPRLYLSYGISLFDDENVVGIRYDLKKGFGIKATTGQNESGVDASYTFDH
ncbi:hypothetical protein F3N42_07925 [Marinihelvus fidelis]|uniref:Translocation and assembly module TamB C-terminal domain-containing protein n=1 Tax=Marinihelvus fidelis TaxID=2613842 RepID=A0A5N0TE18_9GAMM|nr:translocation/assembly module TamB domain-containing protein [Marinihelvus fidelis]KAA9132086.1 hypothetical protein F3N42_07925 [Marinihelvus fidelis]